MVSYPFQCEGGYFVHYFAPVDMSYTPKHITFLIDTSHSMLGTKLDQVSALLLSLLDWVSALLLSLLDHVSALLCSLLDHVSALLLPLLDQVSAHLVLLTQGGEVKEALREILHELNEGDAFSIVSFSTRARTHVSFRHSSTAVRRAVKVIDELSAEGSTDIDEGLKVALQHRRPAAALRLHSLPPWCAQPDPLRSSLVLPAVSSSTDHLIFL
ncbi:von Willebrand factor type A [Trinorchestia longiramus]|nr:von Willebrand factor type A [Trinorchestia longiramus]